ncbi:MAG: hypothetical protein LBE58_05140, partial [Comamonas sp.]|nr:hypothetical protein [Comamonas sp.]
MAHQAHHRWSKQPSLVQQLGLGLDYLKTRTSPLPEPFGDCILLLSVATPGEPVATFYVRRVTLDAAWRAGTTQVRQWAWSRNLDCLELRIDWPSHISALPGSAPASNQRPPVSAWALADESLEQVQLVPPQRWSSAAPAPSAWLPGMAEPPDSLPRAHWLLHLQGLFVNSEGSLTQLPRVDPAPAPSTAPALPLPLPLGDASIAMLQSLAVPEPALSPWSNERLEAFCARIYALLLVQQHYQQQPGDGLPQQRGLSQLLGRAALQLCQQVQRQQAEPAQKLNHALCLLVLARYAQAQRSDALDSVMPVMAQLAQRIGPKERPAHSDLQPPLPTPKPAALAPAWRLVALAAYADCMAADGAASTGPTVLSDTSTASIATPEINAIEALTRHWLQWHLLAHGGASAPQPDWSVIAVAELA